MSGTSAATSCNSAFTATSSKRSHDSDHATNSLLDSPGVAAFPKAKRARTSPPLSALATDCGLSTVWKNYLSGLSLNSGRRLPFRISVVCSYCKKEVPAVRRGARAQI